MDRGNIETRTACQTTEEENARWDGLPATDELQLLLEKMSDEILAEMQTGLARPMILTEDGAIAPDGDIVTWFWIGDHDEHTRLLKHL